MKKSVLKRIVFSITVMIILFTLVIHPIKVQANNENTISTSITMSEEKKRNLRRFK